MSHQWELCVYEDKQLAFQVILTGAAMLGRQKTDSEQIYSRIQVGDWERVVIAGKDEHLSRDHVLIEPRSDGSFKITNKSKISVGLGGEQVLDAFATCQMCGEAVLVMARKVVQVKSLQSATPPSFPIQRLDQPTLGPGQMSIRGPVLSLRPQAKGGPTGLDPKEALRWLQATVDVLQSAASSADFFTRAAQAIIDLVHLKSGYVLLWEEDDWRVQAKASNHPGESDSEHVFSRTVLQRVREEKRTFWLSCSTQVPSASMVNVVAVVAAPILNRHNAVIGALYGERRYNPSTLEMESITELEAMLVEVLARGVAAGLARLEQEQQVMAARVQFEQFFTPELARQLARQPDLLKGRDTEVSLLFCDIRRFSRISERLGPARTVEWISAVMGSLSDCVRAHDGVLVDYIGDELIAMWGAPEPQPNHARRACQAALDMLGKLPELNETWQTFLGEPMDVGIGINTGVARVGNTGSHHKFKYGPLGHTVNLASRVQGVTKYLKCRLLITGATQSQLDDSWATRRLCQVQVVNIDEPVTLYELAPAGLPEWGNGKEVYEQALAEFEAKDFTSAARALGNWRVQQQHDEPALMLLYRSVRCMVEGAAPGHPVWVLTEK